MSSITFNGNKNSEFSEPLAASFECKGFSGRSKAIYGDHDPRKEIRDISDPRIREQARSVACIVDQARLRRQFFSYSLEAGTLERGVERIYGYPLSKDEQFGDQITPGFGTAFLVGDRFLLTAAHCVCKENSNDLDPSIIENKRIVFDFQITEGGGCKNFYRKDEIYRIKKVVAHKFSRVEFGGKTFSDYAVIELDRPVIGRAPLKIKAGTVADKVKLYVIGHPCGLPMKYTDGGEVKANKEEHRFETDSATFHGNSGSPVFDADTREVVGILAAGNEDFEKIRPSQGLPYVISHRVTQEEIEKFGYEVCQTTAGLGFVRKL